MKQTGVPGLSSRAAVGHLGRTQSPHLPLLSGRATLGHLGIGRRYTGRNNLLQAPQLQLPALPPLPDFERLRADAQRLRQQLAAHDRAHAATAVPASAPHPLPLMTAALRAQFQREQQRRRAAYARHLLAAYNENIQYYWLPTFLRLALPKSRVNLLAKSQVAAPTGSGPATGPDCFMPTSFWKSQNPHNDPKVGWRQCCATVKTMVGYNAPEKDRIQIVREQGRSLVLQPSAAAGLRMLDTYMNLHKPVMTGVNHTYGRSDNEGTTDHFIAIVGTGTDAKGKYYRFFDVGTTRANIGTDPRNRLYYDSHTGSYSGKSMVNQMTYTISQLRFKSGTF